MKRTLCLLALVALVALATASAAQAGRPPVGLRAGFTSWEGVKQAHFGGHAKLGDVFPNVALTPGVELGLGDNTTIVTVNADLAYRMTELFRAPWGPYIGGCLSLIFADFDGGGSNTDLGLSGVAGTTYALDNGNEVFGEIRIGLIDSPSFKLTFGYTFF